MVLDEPWFVASDVCAVLDYRDAFNAVRILDADEKGTHNMSTPGGEQRVTIISESGLYALVLRSRKPEARQFRKWVTAEVLPAIRKTGRYETPAAPVERKVATPTEFLSLPFIDVNSPFRFWCLPLDGFPHPQRPLLRLLRNSWPRRVADGPQPCPDPTPLINSASRSARR